jgi:hypothetical protein
VKNKGDVEPPRRAGAEDSVESLRETMRQKAFKHGSGCAQNTGRKIETRYFSGVHYRVVCNSDTITLALLTLGSVAEGRSDGGRGSGCAECYSGMNWTASPHIPGGWEALRDAGLRYGRLGPFPTQQAALQALEDWWLKRLGVSE